MSKERTRRISPYRRVFSSRSNYFDILSDINHSSERIVAHASGTAFPDSGPSCPEWMNDPAYLAMRAEEEDPGDLDLADPDDDPPPDVDEGELAAEAAEMIAAMAADAAGCRGGVPGAGSVRGGGGRAR
jgi:hypothetical protein